MTSLLVASQTISVIIDFALPVALAYCVARKYGTWWRFFGYGMLVFLVFQLITRFPLVELGQYKLRFALASSSAVQAAWMVALAFSAGLFEEIGRYLGYKYLFGDQAKTWDRAVMYGLGHAALESVVLVGGVAALGLATLISLGNAHPGELSGVPTWGPLLNGFERICAIAIQVSLSLVVLQAFLRDSRKWLVVAIVYHTLADLTSVFVGSAFGPVLAEAIAAGWAIFALVLIFRLRGAESPIDETPGHDGPSPVFF